MRCTHLLCIINIKCGKMIEKELIQIIQSFSNSAILPYVYRFLFKYKENNKNNKKF